MFATISPEQAFGRLILRLVFIACLISASPIYTLAASSTATNSIDRLYVFGDSYSDTGAGYVDCDGPTAVGYLAQRLGFPLLPSNAPNGANQSLNFAVSGAQTGRSSRQKIKTALLGLGMRNQVEDFRERVRSGAIRFKPESTLFFIAGGLNDKRFPTETTVKNIEDELQILYGVGGRRFLVALLPVVVPECREMGQRLNPALARIPEENRPNLPHAYIGLSQWGHFFDEVMENPAKFGIKNTTSACAGRAIFNEDATPCSEPRTYYYFHAGHPSTAVHKIVGDRLYAEVLKLPVPAL